MPNAGDRPIRLVLSAGQTSDYVGPRARLSVLPAAKTLLADQSHNADWFSEALIDLGVKPCIPARQGRTSPAQHDPTLCRRNQRIENAFARLKGRRRIATRLTTVAPI